MIRCHSFQVAIFTKWLYGSNLNAPLAVIRQIQIQFSYRNGALDLPLWNSMRQLVSLIDSALLHEWTTNTIEYCWHTGWLKVGGKNGTQSGTKQIYIFFSLFLSFYTSLSYFIVLRTKCSNDLFKYLFGEKKLLLLFSNNFLSYILNDNDRWVCICHWRVVVGVFLNFIVCYFAGDLDCSFVSTLKSLSYYRLG